MANAAILYRYFFLIVFLCAAFWLFRQSFPPSLYFFMVSVAAITTLIVAYEYTAGAAKEAGLLGTLIVVAIQFVTYSYAARLYLGKQVSPYSIALASVISTQPDARGRKWERVAIEQGYMVSLAQ